MKRHRAGSITTEGQFCTVCGKELMSPEEIKALLKLGKKSFKERSLVKEEDGCLSQIR